jgi:hypothetical protein
MSLSPLLLGARHRQETPRPGCGSGVAGRGLRPEEEETPLPEGSGVVNRT